MKRSHRSKSLRASAFTLFVVVPLAMFTLAQIKPQSENPTLKSTPSQGIEAEPNKFRLIWIAQPS